MTYYRFVDRKAGKWLFAIFFFIILLLSRNTLYTSTLLGFARSQLLMFGLVGAAGVLFLVVKRKELKRILTDARIPVALGFAAVILLPMILKGDWQAMYFSVLLCLLVAVFFSYFLSYREVAGYFVCTMVFLGVYSVLAEYVLAAFVERGFFSVPAVYYSESRSLYNFGLSFTVIQPYYFRNYGIFREPGLYQFFLLLALYLNNYALDWKKEWQLWAINGILAVTMLSTFSTVGVVAMGLLAVGLFFDKALYRNKQILRLVCACAVLGVVGLLFIILQQGAIYNTLYTMVEKLFVINDSSGSRYEAIFANIRIFFEHPLLGGGFSEALNAVKHNTSSTTLLYAVFGILGGSMNVLGWVALVWRKERKLWLNLLLLLSLVMAVNTQNFTTDVFFWLFPTMALTEKAVPLIEDKICKRKA